MHVKLIFGFIKSFLRLYQSGFLLDILSAQCVKFRKITFQRFKLRYSITSRDLIVKVLELRWNASCFSLPILKRNIVSPYTAIRLIWDVRQGRFSHDHRGFRSFYRLFKALFLKVEHLLLVPFDHGLLFINKDSLPIIILHIGWYENILPMLISCDARPLARLVLGIETARNDAPAARVQRRHVRPRLGIVYREHLAVLAPAYRRRAIVERRNKTVVCHARVLDGVERRLILHVVQFRAHKPRCIARTDAHAFSYIAYHVAHGYAPMGGGDDIALDRFTELGVVVPDAFRVVLAAPWRAQHSLNALAVHDARRAPKPSRLTDLIETAIVKVLVCRRQKTTHRSFRLFRELNHFLDDFRAQGIEPCDTATHRERVQLAQKLFVARRVDFRDVLLQVHTPHTVLAAHEESLCCYHVKTVVRCKPLIECLDVLLDVRERLLIVCFQLAFNLLATLPVPLLFQFPLTLLPIRFRRRRLLRHGLRLPSVRRSRPRHPALALFSAPQALQRDRSQRARETKDASATQGRKASLQCLPAPGCWRECSP